MYKAVILSEENYRFKGTTLDGLNKKELIQKITNHFQIDYKTLVKEFKTKKYFKIEDDSKGQYVYYLEKPLGFEGYVILVTDADNNYVNLFEK